MHWCLIHKGAVKFCYCKCIFNHQSFYFKTLADTWYLFKSQKAIIQNQRLFTSHWITKIKFELPVLGTEFFAVFYFAFQPHKNFNQWNLHEKSSLISQLTLIVSISLIHFHPPLQRYLHSPSLLFFLATYNSLYPLWMFYLVVQMVSALTLDSTDNSFNFQIWRGAQITVGCS